MLWQKHTEAELLAEIEESIIPVQDIFKDPFSDSKYEHLWLNVTSNKEKRHLRKELQTDLRNRREYFIDLLDLFLHNYNRDILPEDKNSCRLTWKKSIYLGVEYMEAYIGDKMMLRQAQNEPSLEYAFYLGPQIPTFDFT